MTGGFAWHTRWLALLLAVSFGFANVFPLWVAASDMLGRSGAAALPPLVLAVILVAVGIWAWRLRESVAFRPVPLLMGGLLAVFCLALTDVAFPAKRIHVAEYMMLAGLTRFYLARLVSGWWLMGLAGAMAGLCGIHDEMMQGLLPERTFGLSDIAVDMGGAAAGALIGHGLILFGDGAPTGPLSRGDLAKVALVSSALILGLAALLAPLPFYRDLPPPVWIVLPLLVVAPVSATVGDFGSPGLRASVDVLMVLGIACALYPMLPHVTALAFR